VLYLMLIGNIAYMYIDMMTAIQHLSSNSVPSLFFIYKRGVALQVSNASRSVPHSLVHTLITLPRTLPNTPLTLPSCAAVSTTAALTAKATCSLHLFSGR
jgi:hypothetical protein